MSDETPVETQITYCVHSIASDQLCDKCEKLKQEVKDLCDLVEKLNFRLTVKFAVAPPQGLDFIFE